MAENFKPFGREPKKIKQIDMGTGEVIAEFSSITEASKSLGKLSARVSIKNVCEGYLNSAYGYKWEYAD